MCLSLNRPRPPSAPAPRAPETPAVRRHHEEARAAQRRAREEAATERRRLRAAQRATRAREEAARAAARAARPAKPDPRGWTERDKFILAALFARSNFGRHLPEQSVVRKHKDSKYPVTLQGAVVCLCGEFMESDDQEEMFLREAKGWLREVSHCRKFKAQGNPSQDILDFYFNA